MSAILDQLHDDLSADLNRIAMRFKTPVKVTLIVRQPEIEGDAGIMLSNDSDEEIIAEIQRRIARKP